MLTTFLVLIFIVLPLAIYGAIRYTQETESRYKKKEREENKAEQNTVEFQAMADKALEDSFARVQHTTIDIKEKEAEPPKIEVESVQVAATKEKKPRKPRAKKKKKVE